jgi:haloacetate dehalogenase
MFDNFERIEITLDEVTINGAIGGRGFPLLLLHGYPQNYLMWHKIAPRLAESFTTIAVDLRGYGDSSKPLANSDRSNYSKRTMAKDMLDLMTRLGYEEFYLVGHDRGGRVAHRLSLDCPARVKKLALLDILPTYQLYQTTEREFATIYYHWFFLIQPPPLPETLIGGNPEYFLTNCLQRWSKDFSAFTLAAKEDYLRCFKNPDTIRATCEDYRASATIDLLHDSSDLERKINCPLLVLWGGRGAMGKKYDVLASWQEKALDVRGQAIDCGHFLPEEAPQETLIALENFLR